ncbi:AI-2E family transporter, partial [Streptococcus agalactiae]|nr:AI-2E family transporter [Streptococcus agalactiae]MCK6289404.1 AI-2E family transporter [Streptococcus agalactiae]
MNRPSEKEFKNSLFFKWILNNQAVIALMITFL